MAAYAAQIVEPSTEAGGTFQLKLPELESILARNGIYGKKAALFSIVGPSQEEKSFLLYLFVIYLEWLEKGGKGEWLNDKTTIHKLGGFKMESEGIYLWSKPYILKDEHGDEIVVLLMNANSSFEQSAVKESASISALIMSAMLSSVQIINIPHRIGKHDTIYLRTVTEYAKLAALDSPNSSQFGSLLFLIRDSERSDDYPYGYVGEGDIDILFDPSVDLKLKLKTLRESFDSILGFLTPDWQATGDNSKVLENLEPDIKVHLNNFVSSLFGCGDFTLEANKINGKEITCGELFELFKSYTKIFDSNEVPEPKGILAATVEGVNSAAEKRAVKKYNSLMAEAHPFLDDVDILESFHYRAKDDAFEVFFSRPKVRDGRSSESFRRKLDTFLENRFGEMKGIVEANIQLKSMRASMINELLKKEPGNERISRDEERRTINREADPVDTEKTSGPTELEHKEMEQDIVRENEGIRPEEEKVQIDPTPFHEEEQELEEKREISSEDMKKGDNNKKTESKTEERNIQMQNEDSKMLAEEHKMIVIEALLNKNSELEKRNKQHEQERTNMLAEAKEMMERMRRKENEAQMEQKRAMMEMAQEREAIERERRAVEYRQFENQRMEKRVIAQLIDEREERNRRDISETVNRLNNIRALFVERDVKLDEKDNSTLENLEKHYRHLRDKQIANVYLKLRYSRNVQVCFLIDATGSMKPHITAVKETIHIIVKSLVNTNPKDKDEESKTAKQILLAMVAYRDHNDSKKQEVLDFTDSIEEFKEFCSSIVPTGGGDGAEDVFGGFDAALKLNWSSEFGTKVIFHIADAPCHGKEYHDAKVSDDYPDGDPNGLTETELFDRVRAQNMHYYFGKINAWTDPMITKFSDAYGESIVSFDIKDVKNIPLSVIAAVARSISAVIGTCIDDEERAEKERKMQLPAFNFNLKEPDWGSCQLHEGTFIAYSFPESIDNILFDVGLKQTTKKSWIQIAPDPFAHGAERVVYYAKVFITDETEDVVLKEYMGKESTSTARYEVFAKRQTTAAYLASAFMKELRNLSVQTKTIEMLEVRTLSITNQWDKQRYMTAEHRFPITEKFVRFSNNTGYVITEKEAKANNVSMEIVELVVAFSHWTFAVTHRFLMVVDLQGVITEKQVLLTDPAIHCLNSIQFGGNVDLCKQGMESFFESHQCNQYCKLLGLKEFRMASP